MIGNFCHFLSNMGDVSADERFHTNKFRETQQDAILNFVKGKAVLISQSTASGKFVIYQSFLIIAGVVYNRWLSIFSFTRATLRKRLQLGSLMKPFVSSAGKN